MSRWPADARMRLEQAALALFAEQGFAETTVPQIAARAGLTTRTFFRHFADKREVLFAYDGEIPGVVARLFADAPPALTPIEVIADSLAGIAAKFEGERDYMRTRQGIVETDESLRERELRKHYALSEAIRRGFLERGADELSSALAAQIAVSVFQVALGRWLGEDSEPPLSELMRETFDALMALTAEPPRRRPS